MTVLFLPLQCLFFNVPTLFVLPYCYLHYCVEVMIAASLSWKTFSINIKNCICLFYKYFIRLFLLSTPSLLRLILYHVWMLFSCIYWDDHIIFNLLMWWITVTFSNVMSNKNKHFAKLWYIEWVISLSLGSSQYSGRGSQGDKLYYSTMPIKKQSSWGQIAYFQTVVWLFWLVPIQHC